LPDLKALYSDRILFPIINAGQLNRGFEENENPDDFEEKSDIQKDEEKEF